MTRTAQGANLTLDVGDIPLPCSRDDRFTTDVTDTTIHEALKAAELCENCPIRGQCLAYHSSDRSFHGVAAGLLWPAHPVCRTSGGSVARHHNPHCASCTGHRPHPAEAKNKRRPADVAAEEDS
jgi:hypothetical protein